MCFSMVNPVGEPVIYRFDELVDSRALSELLKSLYEATGLSSLVLDPAGRLLASAGWMQGCAMHHAARPELSLMCRRGAAALDPACVPGMRGYALFKCFLGYCDASIPILLEGAEVATIHLGHFFLAPQDLGLHKRLARRHNLPEDFCLEMAARTPVIPPDRLGPIMNFYAGLGATLADQGLKRMRLAAAESALAAEQGRYRRFLASVIDHSYTVRMDKQRIASISLGPGCESVTGYTTVEFEADTMLWAKIVHDDDRQAVIRHFESILAGTAPEPLEYRILRRDGETSWIRNTPVVVRAADGSVELFEGLVQDVTERRLMEEEIRTARRKAEEASRAKSDFLANMSHEIRTPMNAILGLTRLALRRVQDGEVRGFLEGVAEAGSNLLAILGDILDFSKIEAGQMELCEEVFDPAEHLARCLRGVEEQARRKGLALNLDMDGNIPPLARGDTVRLRQVVDNLLGNAVKFTASGSVTLSARMDALGHVLELTVSDTGIGIASDKLDIIFDTFTQADSTTTRRFGGTGLGLAITRRLLAMMGGVISVESAPGRGTQFHVRVPLGRVQEPHDMTHAAQSSCPGRPRARGLRILLAEDEPSNRLFARTFLEEDGHAVTEAHNGEQALELLAQAPFDLVLMDVTMPVMDGLEATRIIRSGGLPGVNPDLPVVGLTAHAVKGDRERFLEAGMNACLVKPLDLDALRRVLSEADCATATPQPTPAGAPAEHAFDHAWISRCFAEKRPTLERLLEVFSGDTPGRIARVREAWESGQADRAAEEAHALKGSAGVMGALRLRRAAEAVEQSARAERLREDSPLVEALEAECRLALEAIRAGGPLDALRAGRPERTALRDGEGSRPETLV